MKSQDPFDVTPTIVVIDDDDALRATMVRRLQHAGYTVEEAATGETGIAMVAGCQPDLVLCDVVLGDISGLEVCQRLKADPATSRALVVMVSGVQISSDSQASALENGADGYLTRPISNRELLARVRAFLRIKNAEDALRLSDRRLRKVIEEQPDAILVVDEAGQIRFANPAATSFFNVTVEDLLGTNFGMPILSDRSVEVDIVSGARKGIAEMRAVQIEWEGEDVHLVSLRDVTERKRAQQALESYSTRLEEMVQERTRALEQAQAQLLRREKLSVLGQMAGSVGHELRNPLGVISNAVYYLKMLLPEADAEVQEYLDMIAGEVASSQKIISDLLGFARVREAEKAVVPPSQLLSLALARCVVPPDVKVQTTVAEGVPDLWVDAQQIVQVLANLITNACQAMEAGGTLSLQVTEQPAYVAMTVADTGSGIAPEDLAQIFEPLFTTKPHGIGLGLPIVGHLVEVNGGSIEVAGTPGVGSTFTVLLPAATERAAGDVWS